MPGVRLTAASGSVVWVCVIDVQPDQECEPTREWLGSDGVQVRNRISALYAGVLLAVEPLELQVRDEEFSRIWMMPSGAKRCLQDLD